MNVSWCSCSVSYYNIQSLSLPISRATAIATIILPILNGFVIQGGQTYAARSRRSGRNNIGFLSRPTIIAFMVLAIYETVIATLAFTHMVPPEDLTCLLERTWYRLYSNKDAGAIRRIQDAHQCCGLNSAKDKAWPFADKSHGADACIKAFGRQKSCMADWRQDEQIYAGLLLLVALMTFAIRVRYSFFRELACRGVDRYSSVTSTITYTANFQAVADLPLPFYSKIKFVGPSYGSKRYSSSHSWQSWRAWH